MPFSFNLIVFSLLFLLWIFSTPFRVSCDLFKNMLCIGIQMWIASFFYRYLDVFCLSQSFITFQICFQIRFVYRDSDLDPLFSLTLSRCVSSIAIFYRVPNMFHLLRSSFAIKLCFVIHDLLSWCFFYCKLLLRSSYVLSITISFLNLDFFVCHARSSFLI